MLVQKTLCLVNKLAGATVLLGGVQFNNGEATLQLPTNDMEGIERYLTRCWQVVDKETIKDGKREDDAGRDDERREVPAVPREVPKKGRTPEGTADDSRGAADSEDGNPRMEAKRDRPESPAATKMTQVKEQHNAPTRKCDDGHRKK